MHLRDLEKTIIIVYYYALYASTALKDISMSSRGKIPELSDTICRCTCVDDVSTASAWAALHNKKAETKKISKRNLPNVDIGWMDEGTG